MTTQCYIVMISMIVHKYVNNIVCKCPNIKYVNIFGYPKEFKLAILKGLFEYEKKLDGVCDLQSTDLSQIILYAYKVVCLFVVKLTTEYNNVETKLSILNM